MKIASCGSLKMHGVRPQVQTAIPDNWLFYEGQNITVADMQKPFSQTPLLVSLSHTLSLSLSFSPLIYHSLPSSLSQLSLL